MKKGFAALEMKIMTFVNIRKDPLVRTGDLVRFLNVTAEQERKVLSRMVRRGLAARVRRGLYLLPITMPIGGRWSPSEALALTTTMCDRGARFQICGPNAFHRYGWDEQVPNRIYAYNERISGDRSVGNVEMTLIRVAEGRLGDTESILTPEKIELAYSSRTRSLVDAVQDWSRFNSLPRAFGWITNDLANFEIEPADLVQSVLRFGNIGTIRRTGYLLDVLSAKLKIPNRLIVKLERALGSTTSTIAWIPTAPKRGQIDKRWGLIVNGTIPQNP